MSRRGVNSMPAFLIKYHRPTGALNVTEFESLTAVTLARHDLDQINDNQTLNSLPLALRA